MDLNKIQNKVEIRFVFEYFQQLGRIQSYSNAVFLSDTDITSLENVIKKLEVLIFCHSTPTVTPKCQILLRHMLPFVRQFRFWGKASKQTIEHIHAEVNKDQRRLIAIKNKKMLYIQLAKLLVLKNFLFDNF